MPRRVFAGASAAVALALATLVVMAMLRVGGAEVEGYIHFGAEALAACIAAVVAFIAAVRSRGRRSAAWFLWSGYSLLGTAACVVSLWNSLVAHTNPAFPSTSDFLFLSEVPVAVVAALLFVNANVLGLSMAIQLVDGLLVAISALTIGLATFLYRAFLHGADAVAATFSIAEPITDVLVLTVLASLVLRAPRSGRPVLALLSLGVAGTTLADLASTYQSALGMSAPGSPFEVGWVAGYLGLGLAAGYATLFRRKVDLRVKAARPAGLGVFLPILPVAAASSFAVSGERHVTLVTDSLQWTLTFLIGLTLVRTCMALYANIQLGRSFEHQAAHDALTGLPNRWLLTQRLEHILTRGRQERGSPTVLLMDIDGFKSINDTYGHTAGDEMLSCVAKRLRGCVRETDLIARLGGDEFAVVIDDKPNRATALGRRILAALELPFNLADGTVTVAASIGAAAAMDGETPAELLRNADLAMYAAKAAGGACQVVYEPAMHAAVAQRLGLESELRLAWMSDAFHIAYQPIVDLQTGEMVGVEALLRWHSDEYGSVPPSVFIPIAEQTGAIIPLGARILRLACSQLATWQRHHDDAAAEIWMSVNVSPRQLFAEDFVDVVVEALRSSGVRPRSLILEITETAAIEHLEAAVAKLNRIRALGVRIALDDFGAGLSSLARLHDLPVDVIKIDKALIDHVPETAAHSAMLHAVMGVAVAMGLPTIVEGVERVEQSRHLRVISDGMAQGYFYSKPVDAEAISAMLGDSRAIATSKIAAVQPSVTPVISLVRAGVAAAI